MADNASQDPVMDRRFLDKQSRTIGTFGMETMSKLISFKVLIVGCGGVGAEVAKNLCLAGVNTISLCDSKTVSVRDIGSNFAVTLQSVRGGKSRAEVTASYMHELNPNTRVLVVEDVTCELVRQHAAVVFTSGCSNLSLSYFTWWNEFCRSCVPAIPFFLGFQCGVFGSVFVDLGKEFTVKDKDGRPALQKSILEISAKKNSEGESYSLIRFETPEGQTPGALRDYTQIKLSQVQGLVHSETGVNVNNIVFDGVVCPSDTRNSVRVYPSFEDQGYSPYITGGFLHELKEVETLSFESLASTIRKPGNFVPVSPAMDNSDESRAHITLHALLSYAEAHDGAFPPLHSRDAADEVLACAETIQTENQKIPQPTSSDEIPKPAKPEFPFKMPPPPPPAPLVLEKIDTEFVTTQALISAAEFQPLTSFFGAVVAQEIVKITGKYSPIFQWFHFSCHDVLPEGAKYGSEEYLPHESRYDHLISILGRKFCNRISNLKVFMVGCGALGCEDIKNFALCGIGCGRRGSLVVTDNDRIEVSNLSRQFLFREENVGQPKSVAAASRMKQINSDAKVDPRQDFIGTSTEHLYTSEFWSSLDVVVNALDNMEARLYVDKQCVRHSKILVEAGTMGTGGNIDIIVPGKTSSYADGGAADQSGGIPMCTLRNFPYIFDHCIEWARAQFDDLFVSPMQSAHQFLEDPPTFIHRIHHEVNGAKSDGEKRSIIEKNKILLQKLLKNLKALSCQPTMETCAQLSVESLCKLFRDRILDLQEAFPIESRKKNGELFWSGHRKYPTPLDVAMSTIMENEEVFNFIVSSINLYACMFGIHPPKPEARFNDENNQWVKEYRTKEGISCLLSSVSVPPYQKGSVEVDDDLKEESENTIPTTSLMEEEETVKELMKELDNLAQSCTNTKASPLEFEKDDDQNFHIDFIAAASNLRASNYSIPLEDKMKVKLVAGKIIPAISTTTSAVTGLSLVELFKVLQGKEVSTLRNGMIDLGTNNYVLFERDPPRKSRSHVESTYIPEQDYTYRRKVICVPEGFTKYDFIPITITPATTVKEFADILSMHLNATQKSDSDLRYEVDGLGVGKGMIWNGKLSHKNTKSALMDVIAAQKEQEGEELQDKKHRSFWEGRTCFFDLSVTVSVNCDDDFDEIDVEIPEVCLRIID